MVTFSENLNVKRRIGIIHTGGTIGGAPLYVNRTFTLEPRWHTLIKEILDGKSEIAGGCEIYTKVPFALLSEEIVPSDWVKLARIIAKEIESGTDGLVVTHGTDTLPFTTVAISFLMQDLPIPIIFTGSLSPLFKHNTDAIRNLSDSILVAMKSGLKGVYVLFPDEENVSTIYLGNRVRQIQPFHDSYETIGNSKVGYVVDNEVRITTKDIPIQQNAQRRMRIRAGFDENVSFFQIHPGFRPELIESIIEKGTKAILLGLYHSGTICTRNTKRLAFSLIKPMEVAIKNKVLVFFLPMPIRNGKTFRYPSSQALKNIGAVGLPPMTWEAAIVKLMWALAQSKNPKRIKTIMRNDIAGEICFVHSSATRMETPHC